MNPLPAIIKELPNVLAPPPMIELDDVKLDHHKKFILCISSLESQLASLKATVDALVARI